MKITIPVPNLGDVRVSDEGAVEFYDTEMGAYKVNTSLAELAYILQEAQSKSIMIQVPADFSQWRGIYGGAKSE